MLVSYPDHTLRSGDETSSMQPSAGISHSVVTRDTQARYASRSYADT